MMDIEEALRVARALPTPTEAARANEALPECVRTLESENTLLRGADILRTGGKEKKPPLRQRAAYARDRRARSKAAMVEETSAVEPSAP
jgi:hypothetical protein